MNDQANPNAYEVISSVRSYGHRIEFRRTLHGDVYASVEKKGIYICNGEWPYEVVEFVRRRIDKIYAEGNKVRQ